MTVDQAISRDPETMSGALCFRGTRVTVLTLFDHLEVVTREMVEAVLSAPRAALDPLS